MAVGKTKHVIPEGIHRKMTKQMKHYKLHSKTKEIDGTALVLSTLAKHDVAQEITNRQDPRGQIS